MKIPRLFTVVPAFIRLKYGSKLHWYMVLYGIVLYRVKNIKQYHGNYRGTIPL